MEEGKLVYKPIEKPVWGLCTIIVSICILLTWIIILWKNITVRAVLFSIIFCECLAFAKFILQASVQYKLCDNELIIENRLSRHMLRVAWESFSYGYFIYNTKGYVFLVLSPARMSPGIVRKQQKAGYKSLFKVPPRLTKQKCVSIIVNDHVHERKSDVEKLVSKHVTLSTQTIPFI